MSTIDPNTSQSSTYTPDYLANPQKDPAKVEVAGSGAGGSSVTIKKDDIQNGIPVSQQGVQDPTQSRTVKSNDPVLASPDPQKSSSEFSQMNAEVTKSIIQYAMTLFGMESQTSLTTLVQKENGKNATDDELTFVRQAIEDYSTESEAGVDYLKTDTTTTDVKLPKAGTEKTPEAKDPIDAWIKSINDLMTDLDPVSTENSTILKTLESKDSQAIAQMLIEASGLETLTNLSPADKELAIAKFNDLAKIIAEKNENGGSYLTGLPIGSFLTVVFARTLGIADDKSLSAEQKELLASLLNNAAEKVASANFQSITSREEPSAEYKTLTGEDSEAIQKLLNEFIKDIDASKLSADQKAALDAKMAELSKKLTDKSLDESVRSKLLSNNPDVVKEVLISLLGDMSDVPAPVSQFLLSQIVPTIAQSMGAINEIELNARLKSSNPEEVEQALNILSGLAHDNTLPPTEKKIIQDYLKVLCQALAFMAQIRSLITRLEGEFTQAIAAAKMATASEQTKNAMKLMETKLEEIQKKYVENADKIRTAEILKYLMPIIAVILLIVAIIVLVVSLIGAIPSGGATAAVGLTVVAQIIALVVAIMVTTAVLVFTIVDTIVNWTTNKGIMDHIYDACGLNDPTARKGITMAINVALVVIIGALTLGAGIVGGIATMASQGVQMTAQVVLQTVMQILKETLKQLFTGPIGAQMIGLIMNAVFSSGFVQDILVKFFKALGLDDEKAMIMTMVVMIIVMLMTILATCGKSIMSGIKSIATAVKSGVQSAGDGIKTALEQGIKQTLMNIFKAIKEKLEALMATLAEKLTNLKNNFMDKLNTLKAGVQAAGETAKSGAGAALEAAMSAVWKALQRLKDMLLQNAELVKNPMNLVKLMELVTAALQVSAQAIKASSAATSAQINQDLAKLAKEVAALEAVMEFLKTAGKIGPQVTMDALNDSAQQMFEDWKKLINMVASFILDASQRTTELHNKAA